MNQPVLFVAREPDETLRTYLPVIDELHRRGQPTKVLFHHWPSDWARDELLARDVSWWHVAVPRRDAPRWLPEVVSHGRVTATLGELAQLRATRALANRIIQQERPSALIVIQD